MTLIEVLVASSLVATIAVGTFLAFDAASKGSNDGRTHAQAIELVQQDQERLRGFTTTTLEQMGTVETYRAENGMCLEQSGSSYVYFNGANNTLYCEKVTGFAGNTYTGTVFTVTSSAAYVTAEKGGEKAALTCEKSGGAASYLQTKSSVTWSALGKRSAVSQTSVLTVPSSYVLLVKVVNQNNEAVEGATVSVTGGPSTVTPASGCVIFGGLSEKVEVDASRTGWVDHQGKSPPPVKTVSLSPTAVTETTFTIGEAGSITAEFESNGVTAGVTGDTFFVFQSEINSPNDFVGGTAGTWVSKTAALTGLFPFVKVGKPATENPYYAFAGDCSAENPETVSAEKLTPKPVQVWPGSSATVKVEVPRIKAVVYEGTEASKGSALNGAESAYLSDEECKAGTGQNIKTTVTYQRKVTLSSTGELEQKYQPYAKELILCVTTKLGAKYYRNTFKLANTKKAGTEYKLYLKAAGYKESSKAGELKCP